MHSTSDYGLELLVFKGTAGGKDLVSNGPPCDEYVSKAGLDSCYKYQEFDTKSPSSANLFKLKSTFHLFISFIIAWVLGS